jgi:hypothetical protein
MPRSGHDDLSAALEKLNSLGNALQLTDLKALGLYLQMSLYGPVQKQFSSSCKTVISERHGLIDTLIYGSIYCSKVKGIIDRQQWEHLVREEMERFKPGSFENILQWVDRLNRFMPGVYDFWNYTGFLKKLFSDTRENIIDRLGHLLQVEMPDEIYFLDIDPDKAFSRLQSRKKKLELHEKPQLLHLLRHKYEELFSYLKLAFPEVKIHRLTDNIFDNIKNTIKTHDTYHHRYEH